MKIIAEVNSSFFDDKQEVPKRIYLSFDKEGCKQLIDTLTEYYEKGRGGSAKFMTEAWGIGPLSAEGYYENTMVPDILELTMID